jgi:aryl-alcohol dehydrogenase-like predicted oxidoreductase
MRYLSYGFSHSRIALAWLLTHPGRLFVFAGAHTPRQIGDYLGTLDVKLP